MEWPPKSPVIFGRDYGFLVRNPPPADYPSQPQPDTFATSSFASGYEERRKAYLEFVLHNPAPAHFKAPFYELGRLAAGGNPREGIIFAALDFIDQRKDCADFVIHSIIRLLYQFGDSPKLSRELLEQSRRTVLSFKYWPSEPGQDGLCSWTENHQILFTSAAYLAGQMFPDSHFTNSNETGREKMEPNRRRILRWLELRFRTGFSEWLSNVYYDEDLTALVNLVDFCQDAEIIQRAMMVIDLILFDMALNSFKGSFASTHGRCYENTKRHAAQEGTTDTTKLLFGTGIFSASDNMSAVCLALSPRYRMPQVIYEIANDTSQVEMINRQRMGILLKEAGRWGLRFDNFEDGMVLLSLEAYVHPRTINLTIAMFDAYRWWDNVFFDMFKEKRGLINFLRRARLLSLLARLFEKDMCRNTREQVNTYTYRTTDYMLSSSQDYRTGYGGDQQHIWQATLAPDAVCFTTHPARYDGPTPNYWAGSGTLPRVAQHKNVVIAIYNISTLPGIYLTNRLFFTHAWLPRDQFDEFIERSGWVFARKGDGYLALRSRNPTEWQNKPGEDQGRELIARGKQNIWICELGRRVVDGEFADFVERICQARLVYSKLGVAYHSPSQGLLEFAWNGSLKKDGKPIVLGEYPRYDNPYSQVPFDGQHISICKDQHWLELDWYKAVRKTN